MELNFNFDGLLSETESCNFGSGSPGAEQPEYRSFFRMAPVYDDQADPSMAQHR